MVFPISGLLSSDDAALAPGSRRKRGKGGAKVENVEEDSPGETLYCVCRSHDEGFMIECSDGTSGCNGWFHPGCCGLDVSQGDEDALGLQYVCSLCVKAQMKRDKLARKKSKEKDPGGKQHKKSKHHKSKKGLPSSSVPPSSVASSEAESAAGSPGRKRKRPSRVPRSKYAEDNSEHESDLLSDVEMDVADMESVVSQKSASRSRGDTQSPDSAELVIEKILGRRLMLDEEDEEEEASNAAAAGLGVPAMRPPPVKREYFLIKWKGRSYVHCSWEREGDLEQVDPSAKLKLRRWYTQMKAAHGPQWREVLEAEQDEDLDDEMEYFSPDLVQVQRVVACNVAQVRHEARLRAERLAVMSEVAVAAGEGGATPARGSPNLELEDTPDPEDDEVLYLVKWKGLGYECCSWEPFAVLKWASDAILDFWDNQRPPSDETLLGKSGAGSLKPASKRCAGLNPGHTLALKEFRKLTESPTFGISKAEIEAGVTDVAGLTLREYQLQGVNWLLWNWWNHRPSILADEMGLGKTIQTTAFLHELHHNDAIRQWGPSLIVAPLSLVVQWQSEMATWSPDLNVVVYHGNAEARQIIQDKEWFFEPPYVEKERARRLKKAGVTKFQVMITTFEVALKEVKALSRIAWKVLIVDEAHRLKNPDSKLFQELNALPRDHCVLLTGTPLQNKTEELWALLHFCDSGHFNDQAGFLEKFGDLKDAGQVAMLHQVLKPYILRRVKEDVEKSLPPKEETIIEVSLTPIQRQFYRAIYEKNTSFLFKGARASNAPSLMNVMMELRKCCNHPYLNRGVEARILSEIPAELLTPANIAKQLVDASGKMVLLSKLLPRLHSEGHKVLIFSQMVRCLDLIEDFLKSHSYKFERLDGNTRSNVRTAAVERFNRPQFGRFVMLLSTRAGGLGLNLTSADTVIIFDSDWNPHNDLQAQARAHRIGQTKSVAVYRLLTKKTYEMHMFHQASLKLGLDKAMLIQAKGDDGELQNGGSTGSGRPEFSTEEIDHLLKKGAYDVFREDDEEAKDFVESDIDAIMARSARKVDYSGSAASASSSKLSSGFSKASFVSTQQDEEVDLDDPDFWSKAIGFEQPAEPEAEETKVEVVPAQRSRKQTKMYSYDPITEAAFESESEEEVPPEKKRKKRKDSGSTRAPRQRKPLRPLGPHNRDRLIKSLLQYGFGRWRRIQLCAGVTNRDLEDIESFARSYVLQLGICTRAADAAAPSKRRGFAKKDSPFIREAVAAAARIQNKVALGDLSVTIPPVLSDPKFTKKLSKPLVARKALIRLDLLNRLRSRIASAVQIVLERISPAFKAAIISTPALDDQVILLQDMGIAQALQMGTYRPPWAQLEPWWDNQADRDLLLGTFLHGFGCYKEILSDRNLCFRDRLGLPEEDPVELDVDNSAMASPRPAPSADGADSQAGSRAPHPSSPPTGARPKAAAAGIYSFPPGGGAPPSDASPFSAGAPSTARTSPDRASLNGSVGPSPVKVPSAARFLGSSALPRAAPAEQGQNEALLLGMSVDDNSGLLESTQAQQSVPGWPEVKHLNKLTHWLLADPEALLSQEEVEEKAVTRVAQKLKDQMDERALKLKWMSPEPEPLKVLKKKKTRKETPELKESDVAAFAVPAPKVIAKSTVKAAKGKGAPDTSELDEEGSAGKGKKKRVRKPRVRIKGKKGEAKKGIAKRRSGNWKKLTQIIDKQEASAISCLESWAECAEGAKSITPIEDWIDEVVEILSELPLAAKYDPLDMSIDERKAIVAALLSQGSPPNLSDADINPLLLRIMEGLQPNDDRYDELLISRHTCFDWDRILSKSQVEGRTEEELAYYYVEHLLPLCTRLCRPEALEDSQLENGAGHSFFPDPTRPTFEHSPIARGVAYIFLKRIQLLRSIRFILSRRHDALAAWCRSAAAFSGPTMEGLPQWWCPWIHDIGLLVGSVKHGLLSVEALRTDADLPFHLQAIRFHVQRAFLRPGPHDRSIGSARGLFPSDLPGIGKWVYEVSEQFPGRRALEDRLFHVAFCMTKQLPVTHPLRIRAYNIMPSKC
jgi:superfamily II DNA or RNA helicase